MVKGGAALWKNCSAWSLEKMIQRSGLSARSRSPISAATARTCSTFALSSVSGMVKNCGACGSMAPPTTVEIINPLLGSLKSIALGPGQQRGYDHRVRTQKEFFATALPRARTVIDVPSPRLRGEGSAGCSANTDG